MDAPKPPREPETAPKARRIAFALVVLSLLYLLTHGGNLGRELTSEEGYFTLPGRLFFETGRYEGYFGENLRGGSAQHNPFHKPPGVSLVLGACSYLAADGVTGARLAPLLAGWFALLLPLLLTRRWLPSALVLMAPFFYAGSSHLQTDPVIGVLGYGLILVYWQRVWNGGRGLGWLIAGNVIAWTGKIEIGVIAATASAIASLLLWRGDGGRARLLAAWRDLAIANAIGIGSFVLLTWALGRTAGYGFGESVGYVIDTILRIGKILEVNASQRRPALFQLVANFHGWELLWLLVVPAGLGAVASRGRGAGALGTYAVFGVLPFVVYGLGSWVGDGYPRYFLIGYLALAVAAGAGLDLLAQRFGPLAHGVAAAAMLATGAFLFVPPTVAMLRDPGAVTVQRGTTGWRTATQLADAKAPAGSWIVGPERGYWYGRGRPWLFVESFDPYPEMRDKAFAFVDKVGAVILPKSALDKPVEFSETTLLPRLLAQGTWDRFVVQDVAVWVRR